MHLHKLIYKFQEDLELLVEDVNEKDRAAFGRNQATETVGVARVQQIFNITDTEKKGQRKMMKVAGSRVDEGLIDKGCLFRVIRNDEVLQEGMQLQ